MKLAALLSILPAFVLAIPSATPLTLDQKAANLLEKYPLIDTHVDLPQVMRVLSRRPYDEIEKIKSPTGYPGHVDLPRLRKGGVGGLFLTAWTPCLDYSETGEDFLLPTDTVRDTLESIDLIKELVRRSPDYLKFCRTADDVRQAFKEKKISALIGMEGSHMLGGSLSVMRMYAELGVKYLTLTHVCHSPFASSNGGGAGTSGSTLAPVHAGNGLTAIGKTLVKELNRLGVMVDLSHVTDQTVSDALDVTRSPVIWSHSASRSIFDHPRNIPDSLLRRVGSGPGQNRGVIQSIAVGLFLGPLATNATVSLLVDHVEHIASIVGRAHVGLGSDFDGIDFTVVGLEDASKWPNVIKEFIRRGWSEAEMEGLMGGNLLRVMAEVEQIARDLRDEEASPEIYDKRTDLPSETWAGPKLAYVPDDVKVMIRKYQGRLRDEL